MPNDIWTTGDEIRFLKEALPKEITRVQFLQNYKEALNHRINWDVIDKKRLLRVLNNEINKECKGV